MYVYIYFVVLSLDWKNSRSLTERLASLGIMLPDWIVDPPLKAPIHHRKHYRVEGYKGGPSLGPHYVEREAILSGANMSFFSSGIYFLLWGYRKTVYCIGAVFCPISIMVFIVFYNVFFDDFYCFFFYNGFYNGFHDGFYDGFYNGLYYGFHNGFYNGFYNCFF